MRKFIITIVALVTGTSVVRAEYVAFVGSNNNPTAPVGCLVVAANWEGGKVPSGSSTGLVTATAHVWSGTLQNLAIRQTGGFVGNAASVAMRGGTAGSGIATIYEIEDPRPDYAAYTNLTINGTLTLWSQFGESIELSLLSGHVEMGALTLSARGKGTINLRDGILHAVRMDKAIGTVNMLAGGTGDFIVDVLDADLNKNLSLNFETGNEGRFTLGGKSGGVSAAGTWQWFILNGQVSIDGTVDANSAHYAITGSGLGSTISLGSGTAMDIPVQPDTLLGDHILPPINFSPGEEYGSNARKYQGIPTIERAPGGRLWASWYAGPLFEDQFNYVVAVTSGDDGATWSDLKLVIDPDGAGPLRASDPSLWLDPDGKLWLFWWLDRGGLHVTMAIHTENPDAENPLWSEPIALFPGVMVNKPIATENGEWLMPTAMWNRDNSCRVMVSKDRGETWALRGAANVPVDRRQCDEPMLVERNDGSFQLLVRTKVHGIGESISVDGGHTWTEAEDYLPNATARFHLRRLMSGNLLLIKHGALDERLGGRSHLTAYLSEDDGATWKGGLLIDERLTVSYPDTATQGPDGTIHMIYDWNRFDEKNILMSTFTEEDILAGAYVSGAVRSRVLINRATGINPKSLLRTDRTAAPLRTDPVAEFTLETGAMRPLNIGGKVFNNRDYVIQELPWQFFGDKKFSFAFSDMDQTAVLCCKSGMAYAFTPLKDRNQNSVEEELLAQGFEKTSLKEFFLFATPRKQPRLSDACSVYQKQVEVGEEIQFGKWGILVF